MVIISDEVCWKNWKWCSWQHWSLLSYYYHLCQLKYPLQAEKSRSAFLSTWPRLRAVLQYLQHWLEMCLFSTKHSERFQRTDNCSVYQLVNKIHDKMCFSFFPLDFFFLITVVMMMKNNLFAFLNLMSLMTVIFCKI